MMAVLGGREAYVSHDQSLVSLFNEAERMTVSQLVQQNAIAKGIAIVVGNQSSLLFSNKEDYLQGPFEDLKAMWSIFKRLNYAVLPLLNASKSKIITIIKEVAKEFPVYAENDLRYKRIVFSFSGHGHQNSCIHAHDGEVNVDKDIVWPLLPQSCPRLGNIPKLFFIDACRGSGKDFGVRAPIPRGGGEEVYSRISGMANYLLVYSTQPTMIAYELPTNQGGYWTQAFVHELHNSRNQDKDVYHILVEVNKRVNEMFNIPLSECTQQSILQGTLHEHVVLLDEAKKIQECCPVRCWSQDNVQRSPFAPVCTPQASCYNQYTPVYSQPPTGVDVLEPQKVLMEQQSPGERGPSTVSPPTIGQSEATLKPKMSPVKELESQLTKMSDGETPKIEYNCKEVGRGYRATVCAPFIGCAEGEVCSSESRAKKSAATNALEMIKQI